MTTSRNPTVSLLSTLVALALVGCAGGPDLEGPDLRSAPEAVTPAQAAEAATPASSADAPAAATAEPATVAVKEWRPWMEAQVDRLRREQPDTFDAVMALEARPTRAGLLRLTGPAVRNPDAAPILLYRLLSKGESTAVRAAIVEALPRTGGDFSAAAAELMALETAPEVREVLCAALQRAQAPHALEGLALGVADTAARVRAQALRSLGARPDGAQLSEAIIAALTDADPVVQQEAARASGNLALESATDALRAQLGASSPAVRLHALRALSRIDPAGTKALPELTTLRSDADPKVARLAERLATEG
ncbi:HEAT repeat domain-containing protein [Paraliomyxa miuraensis]|uniref:HEAT repeat domain-containing protein n=1 Tax=Paraliomyxa miuraensis TaxID=376150 RepID=UPI00224FBE48|nr:HEAT repeat domain-containing protein [Paraliomyxa miuraensis]MCX4241009.1 HEAT repeat domain-containing protein [Paraliomyxa miuraensis]